MFDTKRFQLAADLTLVERAMIYGVPASALPDQYMRRAADLPPGYRVRADDPATIRLRIPPKAFRRAPNTPV